MQPQEFPCLRRFLRVRSACGDSTLPFRSSDRTVRGSDSGSSTGISRVSSGESRETFRGIERDPFQRASLTGRNQLPAKNRTPTTEARGARSTFFLSLPAAVSFPNIELEKPGNVDITPPGFLSLGNKSQRFVPFPIVRFLREAPCNSVAPWWVFPLVLAPHSPGLR